MRRRVYLAIVIAIAFLLLVPGVALAKTRTKIQASLSSPFEYYDSSYDPVLTGQLKTSRGKPIAKKTVALYRDGVKIATARTNSKGRVQFKALTADGTDISAFCLKFAGDRKYGSSRSPVRTVQCAFVFDGPATPQGTRTWQGVQVFDFNVQNISLVAGQQYCFFFSHPSTVMIGYNMESGFVDGSDGAPVSRFEFTAPTDSPYIMFASTSPSWGGGDGSLDVTIW